MDNMESLRAFYLDGVQDRQSLFHLWEDGKALGDSVTPAVYSSLYRQWMCQLLSGLLAKDETPALLSVGCGNAMVEAELVATGHRVLGADALTEAVALARSKGVEAVRADVLTWTPPPQRWTVVYADGLLGHLYDPAHGVRPALDRFRSWLPQRAGTLVVSIDHPRSATDVEPHSSVPGFVWLSTPYLCKQLAAAGFDNIESTVFQYERPLSGPRDRVVVTAKA
jgi:SAM-dependent methyltransferase